MGKKTATRAKTVGLEKLNAGKKVPASVAKQKAAEAADIVADSFEEGDEKFAGESGTDDVPEDTFGAEEDQAVDEDDAQEELPSQAQSKVPKPALTTAKGMTVVVAEGDFVNSKGKMIETAPYQESFVLPESFSDNYCRAVIRKVLLSGRLKSTREGFRRVRTVSIVDRKQATIQDIKQFGLQETNVDVMTFAQLAMYCAENSLGVIPAMSSTIDEARYLVKKAFKDGKRVPIVAEDTKPIKAFPGEVDKTNRPLAESRE